MNDPIALVGAAFSGAAAVLVFTDRRDRALEARIEGRWRAEIDALRFRIARLEESHDAAVGHIVVALDESGRLSGTETIRQHLRLALEALSGSADHSNHSVSPRKSR